MFFMFDAFQGFLLKQAHILARRGCEVSLAYPDAYEGRFSPDPRIKLIPFKVEEAVETIGGWKDPSEEFYTHPRGGLVQRTSEYLAAKLPLGVDCVLLWENPAPYLERIYDDALIVHQMPGAFSRAPYPATVTFDPAGLYKESLLFKNAAEIRSSYAEDETVHAYIRRTKDLLCEFQYKTKKSILEGHKKSRLALIPLQISDHYAFKADTGFASQIELCIAGLKSVPEDQAVFISEYVSANYPERRLNQNDAAFLNRFHPAVIVDFKSSSLPSISQFLLPHLDAVVTAASSLALQSLAWDIPVEVIGDTFLKPYGRNFLAEQKQRRSVLAFLLEHYQPLQDKVSQDGDFLLRLLRELKSRRKMKGVERLAKFTELEKNYGRTLLASFRRDETEADFIRHKRITDYSPSPHRKKFWKLMEKNKPRLVSFDLFGTLVSRGFEAPADVFDYLEQLLWQEGFKPPFDFARKRLRAEMAAREKSRAEEITLDDIYRELNLAAGLSEERLEYLKAREREAEIHASKARPIGRRLYEAALGRGCAICVTSDMYLDRACLDEILANAGYHPESVYLSSEIGLTKKTGGLFDFILKTRKISPEEMIHVGDMKEVDVSPARRKGISAYHLPQSVERLYGHPIYASVFKTRSFKEIMPFNRSAMMAAIAERLFDDQAKTPPDSLSGGDPAALGYAVFGPVVFGYAAWLRRAALNRRVRKLYFLSREGRIIKDVFDIISGGEEQGLASRYLYASRRAVLLAAARNWDDLVELTNASVHSTAAIGSILQGRFGLAPESLDGEAVKRAGFRSLDEKLFASPENINKLRRLLSCFKPLILRAAENEREAYSGYLKQEGLFSGDRTAVVDIGWQANMQGALGALLEKPLIGYYLATRFQAERWKRLGHEIYAYLAEGYTTTRTLSLLEYPLILEYALCEPGPSLKRIKKENGAFVPVFDETPSNGNDRAGLVGLLQSGIRAFAFDMREALGRLTGTAELRPDLTLPLLDEFISNPSRTDAAIFAGEMFDDSFSGAEPCHLVAPLDKRTGRPKLHDSYWKPGAKAFYGAGNESFADSLSRKQKLVMWLISPVVKKLAHAENFKKFRENPAIFFKSLKNRKYRAFGDVFFPL